MKAQLCRCNNCDTIMIDKNPGEQPELLIPDNCKDMAICYDEDTPPEHGFFWGCPNCLTDGYFQDVYEL